MLALLALLAGLAVAVFGPTLGRTRVRDSATRLAALLRAARAEAATTGRRLRLSFDEQTHQPTVSIEPEPLKEPGTFRPYQAWWVRSARLPEGLSVVSCELLGASALTDEQILQGGQPAEQDQPHLAEVTFYPDGGSDSARILLAEDTEDQPWAAEITLNGVDGTIQVREVDTEEEPIERP